MIKLKTKTEFQIPTKRGVIQGIVRLIIDKLEIDTNNIIAKGYYYFIDENGQIVQLDMINTMQQWENIEYAEHNALGSLQSSENLKDNILQRLNEFTFYQLQLENGENYGTYVNDWEIDND